MCVETWKHLKNPDSQTFGELDVEWHGIFWAEDALKQASDEWTS